MSGTSRKGGNAKSSDYGVDLENLSPKGSYPSPIRQSARLEEVVLCSDPDLTKIFVRSVTFEVNGFSSESVPPVDEDDMLALFYYAVLAKLAFVTHLRGNMFRLEDDTPVRDSSGEIARVRRLDALWVLPSAYIPVLGSIGELVGVHPVTYRPIITDNIVTQAVLAINDPDFSDPAFATRLERVESALLTMERRGLLVARGIPRNREGNPDVMTSILWERELFFRREGVEGVIAAIAGSVSPDTLAWRESDVDAKAFIMETFVGRAAFPSVYLPEDLVLAIDEMARDYTRER